jgi:hypothetical protein
MVLSLIPLRRQGPRRFDLAKLLNVRAKTVSCLREVLQLQYIACVALKTSLHPLNLLLPVSHSPQHLRKSVFKLLNKSLLLQVINHQLKLNIYDAAPQPITEWVSSLDRNPK